MDSQKLGLNKTLKILEDNEINYIEVIKNRNYEIESNMKFKQKNKYIETYEKAYRYITIKNRINAIHNYLIENIDSPNIKNKIQIVEEALFAK